MTLPALPAVDPSVLADTASLGTLQQAAAAHNPQALRQAAQQFESLFVGMMLKSAQQANFSDPLFGSVQASMYQDMYDDQIAAEISKGRGLGLADMLVQQLRRSGLPGTTQGSSTTSTASGVASAASTAATSAGAVETSKSPVTGSGVSSPAATATSPAPPSGVATATGGPAYTAPGTSTSTGCSSQRAIATPCASRQYWQHASDGPPMRHNILSRCCVLRMRKPTFRLRCYWARRPIRNMDCR